MALWESISDVHIFHFVRVWVRLAHYSNYCASSCFWTCTGVGDSKILGKSAEPQARMDGFVKWSGYYFKKCVRPCHKSMVFDLLSVHDQCQAKQSYSERFGQNLLKKLLLTSRLLRPILPPSAMSCLRSRRSHQRPSLCRSKQPGLLWIFLVSYDALLIKFEHWPTVRAALRADPGISFSCEYCAVDQNVFVDHVLCSKLRNWCACSFITLTCYCKGEKSRGTKVEEEKSNVSLAKSSDTDQADPSPLSKIFKSQSEKWECHVCLVKNNRDADKCVACAAPCPGQTKPPLSTLFQAKSNKWECEVCMVRNDQSQAACVACATPKPGAQPVKKADEKSSSSANFNFKTSLNSSEAGGQDTKSTPVFTQLIKPRTKKWECPCCMVQNDEAKDKCACCETKKPNDASKNDIFSSSHSQTVSQSMSTPAETFSRWLEFLTCFDVVICERALVLHAQRSEKVCFLLWS